MKRLSLLSILLIILSISAGAAEAPVTDVTLSNGMRVVLVQDRLAPVVTVVTNYKVGSDDEPITGLAHAQEHMMFRGSRTVSASQFAEVTAITGGAFNADTQDDCTQFYFVMPSQYLDLALHLEASRAQGLLDSQKLWNQERGAIMQEVTRDNSSADYRLYVKMLHHLMAGSPYADEGLGTLKSFGKQIQARQLKHFYHTWYHPNNIIMVIAGNIDPATTLKKVKALFGSIPAAKLPARKPVHLTRLKSVFFTDRSDNPYLVVYQGYRYPGYSQRDYAASLVLREVLNSQRGALVGLTASGKALAAGFESEEFRHAGVGFAYIAVPASVKPQTAVKRLRRALNRYRNHSVPPDLVEAARKRMVAAAAYKGNSIRNLAFQWSAALVNGFKSPDELTRAIARVRTSDVNRVLRLYLNDSTACLAYSIPSNSGKVSHGGGAKAPENNTIIPTEHQPLPKWARYVLHHLAVPAQTLHPVSMVLPNGLRLIVQPEHTTRTVLVAGRVRSNPGMQQPQGQEGVSGIVEDLLPYGTRTYNRLQYQAQLDKIAANVSTGTDFSLSVLAKHFSRGMQLLADDELHPAFPRKAFAIVKRQHYAEAVGEQKAPGHLASVALVKGLFPKGDPSRREVTPASVKSITLKDVHAYYRSVFRPDMTTIVVVGDVTPAQARGEVALWFGDWTATGPKPAVDNPQVPDNRPSSTRVPDTGRIQDSVTLAETLKLTRRSPEFPVLAVANTVLSGGFYASLLFHSMREVTGYVYTVDSNFAAGKHRAIFSIDYGCNPDNVDKAQALAVKQLKRLQRTPLSKQRLLRAKALLLGAKSVEGQSYSGVAGMLLSYASHQLPLDQNLIDARRELAVTAKDVMQVCARWLRPHDFVRVVQGPGIH